MLTVLAAVAAYLIGSIPSGLLVSRSSGVDLRQSGSGNIGATNVARTVGAGAGVLTLVADVLKGLAPTLAASLFGGNSATVGLATVVGHVYPVFGGFRGGKGVATACGAFSVLAPLAMCVSFAGFAAVAVLTRYISAASLVAALTLPVACAAIGYDPGITAAATVTAALVVARHGDNIRRLWRGTEPPFRVAGT